jgi:hypothetical protein
MTRYTPLWEQLGSYAASTDRHLLSTMWPNGVINGMVVSAGGSSMQLQISSGQAAVPSQNNTGSSLCISDAVENVVIAAAPGSGLNRIDLVLVRPRGQDLDGGSNNDFIFDTSVTGVPAATPVAPSVPAGSLALAQVYVGANVVAITQGNITDVRQVGSLAIGGGIALPPLGSAAPFQSQTDAQGEVWVAKGGVNGGVWYKARDVLGCTYYRAAAFTVSTASSPIAMDTMVYDPYGLYNSGSAIFTAPVAGTYRFSYQLSASATAAGQNLQPQLTVSGTSGNWLSENVSGGAQVFSAQVVASIKLTAGQTVTNKMLGTAIPGWIGTYGCWLSVDYVGTGGGGGTPGGPSVILATGLPPNLGPTDPFQTFTTSDGEVWVAKGGVNGGQWRKARDVLKARVYRQAAISTGAGSAFNNMPFDTVSFDAYGMMVLGTDPFTCVVPGTYDVRSTLSTGGAANNRVICSIFKNGTEAARGTDINSGTGSHVSDMIPLVAGDKIGSQLYVSVTGSVGVGSYVCWISVAYRNPT